MKIKLDPSLTGKAKYDFLIANKSAFIAQKKMPHWADELAAPVETSEITKTVTTKADDGTDVTETIAAPGTVEVKFFANTCMYWDSQADVLLIDSSKRTLNNNKDLIQHLHDHIQKTDAIIGDMEDITLPYVAWRTLGVNIDGQAQVIYCHSIVREVYNEKLYNLYKNKRIKQHSIGLQYVQIALAIADPDYKEEYALWLKWIDQIANKEDVIAAGYFWAVAEIKLIEVSAVLYGANSLTGVDETITDEDDSEEKSHSLLATQEAVPAPDNTAIIKTMSELIKETNFINLN